MNIRNHIYLLGNILLLLMISGSFNRSLYQKLAILTATPALLSIAALVYIFFTAYPDTRGSTTIIAVITVLLLAYALAARFFIKKLKTALTAVRQAATTLASGAVDAAGHHNDVAAITVAIRTLREELARKEEFSRQLQAGNLSSAYQVPHTRDALGHALLEIRQTLLHINEEDQQRKWSADALARFVNVLRANKSLRELANDVIINLVQTLNATQGAIYIIDAEGKFLDLQGCYAYGRTKHLNQKIEVGDGLLGQAYREKETVYLKKVPDNFVRITSGLGEANPNAVLIVPLKMDKHIAGIVELASFKEFSPAAISFVQKIGESIAHTITSFRVTENTQRLLNESHSRAEQMRIQEEALRQNQEELQATQEEISRKYNALFKQLTELNYQARFEQLKSITSTKKLSIEYYFDIIRNQILTFAENKMIGEAVKAFRDAFYAIRQDMPPQQLLTWQQELTQYYTNEFIPHLSHNTDRVEDVTQYIPTDPRTILLQYQYIAANPNPTGAKSLLNDPLDGSQYSHVHATYHPIIRSFLEKFGYYDIFLIDHETGDMLYSVFKEVDFGTSLLSGRYSNTNFGHVVRQAIAGSSSFVKLIDFEPYDPSYRTPASFIACPIFDQGKKAGILVFQMPINKINQILTGNTQWHKDGLGESGETFIAGSDYTMRSIARQLIQKPDQYEEYLAKAGHDSATIRQIRQTNTNILLETIRTGAVTQALQGASGVQLETNAGGQQVLNAFAPLNIEDVHWVIVSTMTEHEASERINDLRQGKL